MKRIITGLMAAFALLANAQQVSDVDFHQDGDNIVVTYDLSAPANTITLFLSEGDKDWEELTQVTGDVGANIPAGHHSIVWDIFKEKKNGVTDNIRFVVKPNFEGATWSAVPSFFPKSNMVIRGNKAYGAEKEDYKKAYAGDVRKGTFASATDNVSFNMVVYEYDFVTSGMREINRYRWSGRVPRKVPVGSNSHISLSELGVQQEPAFELKMDKKGKIYLGRTLVVE